MKTPRWTFFVYLLLIAVYGASLAGPGFMPVNKETAAQTGYEDTDGEEEKDGKEDVIEYTKIVQAGNYRLHAAPYLQRVSRSASSKQIQRIIIASRAVVPGKETSPNFLCVFRL